MTDMAIFETGIFTTQTQYLSKITELRVNRVKLAQKRGYMSQTGVRDTEDILSSDI